MSIKSFQFAVPTRLARIVAGGASAMARLGHRSSHPGRQSAKAIAAALLTTALPIAPAHALTAFFDASFAPQTPPWSDTAGLALFDPSLGTLTGVAVTLHSSISGTSYVQSLLDHSDVESAGNNGVIELSAPGITSLINIPAYDGPSTTLAPYSGIANFAGPDTVSTTGVGFDSETAFPTDLADYTGTGLFLAHLLVHTGRPEGFFKVTDNLGTPLLDLYDTDLIAAIVSVNYTYDAPVVTSPPVGSVPEPASWAMMFAGFSLMGMMARNSRRQAGSGDLGRVLAAAVPPRTRRTATEIA